MLFVVLRMSLRYIVAMFVQCYKVDTLEQWIVQHCTTSSTPYIKSHMWRIKKWIYRCHVTCSWWKKHTKKQKRCKKIRQKIYPKLPHFLQWQNLYYRHQAKFEMNLSRNLRTMIKRYNMSLDALLTKLLH